MSKLAYVFLSLVGAIPAGGALYLLIMNLLERSDRLGGLLLGVTITAAVCMTLVVLTPVIILVAYKDTRPKPQPGEEPAGGASAAAAAAGTAAAEGFGDAIPEDFDEEELAASQADEYEAGEYDDAEYEDADYDEGEFEDFDLDEK